MFPPLTSPIFLARRAFSFACLLFGFHIYLTAAGAPVPVAAQGFSEGLAAFYVIEGADGLSAKPTGHRPLFRCEEVHAAAVAVALRAAGFSLAACKTTQIVGGAKVRTFGEVTEYSISSAQSSELSERVGAIIRGVLRKKYGAPPATLSWKDGTGVDYALRRLYMPIASARRYLKNIDAEGSACLSRAMYVDMLWVLMKALDTGSDVGVRAAALQELLSSLGKILTPDKVRVFVRMLEAEKREFADNLCSWAAYAALLIFQKNSVAEIKTSLGWALESPCIFVWFTKATEYYARCAGKTEALRVFQELFLAKFGATAAKASMAAAPKPAPAPTPSVAKVLERPTVSGMPAEKQVAGAPVPSKPISIPLLASFFVLGKDGEQELGRVPVHRCSSLSVDYVTRALGKAGYQVRVRKRNKSDFREFNAGTEYLVVASTGDRGGSAHAGRVERVIEGALSACYGGAGVIRALPAIETGRGAVALVSLYLPRVIVDTYAPAFLASPEPVLGLDGSFDALWVLIQILEGTKENEERGRLLRQQIASSVSWRNPAAWRIIVEQAASGKMVDVVGQWAAYCFAALCEKLPQGEVDALLGSCMADPVVRALFKSSASLQKIAADGRGISASYVDAYEDSDLLLNVAEVAGECPQVAIPPLLPAREAVDAPRGSYTGPALSVASARRRALTVFHILAPDAAASCDDAASVLHCDGGDAELLIENLLEAGFNVRPRQQGEGARTWCGNEYVAIPTTRFNSAPAATAAIKKGLGDDAVTVISGGSYLYISRALAASHFTHMTAEGVCALADGVSMPLLWLLLQCSRDIIERDEQIVRWISSYPRIVNAEAVRQLLRGVYVVGGWRHVSQEIVAWALYIALRIHADKTPREAKKQLAWVLNEPSGYSALFKMLFLISSGYYCQLPGRRDGHPFQYINAAICGGKGFLGECIEEEPEPDNTPRCASVGVQTECGRYWVESLSEGGLTLYMDRCGEPECRELITDDIVDAAHVKKIVGRGCKVRRLLKKLLALFPQLVAVQFNECDLGGELPPDLLHANPRLQVFDIAGNEVTTIPAGFFDRTPELAAIDFADNRLQGPLPLTGDLAKVRYFSCAGNEGLTAILGAPLPQLQICDIARCPALAVCEGLASAQAPRIVFMHGTRLPADFGATLVSKPSVVFASLPDGTRHHAPDPTTFAKFAQLMYGRLQAMMLRNPYRFRTTNHQKAGTAPWSLVEGQLIDAIRRDDVKTLVGLVSYEHMQKILRESYVFFVKAQRRDRTPGSGVAESDRQRPYGSADRWKHYGPAQYASPAPQRGAAGGSPCFSKEKDMLAVDMLEHDLPLEEYSDSNRALTALFISVQTQLRAIYGYCSFVSRQLGISVEGGAQRSGSTQVIARMCAAQRFILGEEDKAMMEQVLLRTKTPEYAERISYGFAEVNEAWRAFYEFSAHLQVLYDALMQRVLDMPPHEWASNVAFTARERACHEAEWLCRKYTDSVHELTRTLCRVVRPVFVHFQKLGGLCLKPFEKEIGAVCPDGLQLEFSFEGLMKLVVACEGLAESIGQASEQRKE